MDLEEDWLFFLPYLILRGCSCVWDWEEGVVGDAICKVNGTVLFSFFFCSLFGFVSFSFQFFFSDSVNGLDYSHHLFYRAKNFL